MKINDGMFFWIDGEKRKVNDPVTITRITTAPIVSANPHAAEMIELLVMFILILLYMDVHLVIGYLYTFFGKSNENLPENPVKDRMPVIIMFYPDEKFEIL